uniref:Uncharacterized protein n=1 Tax=Aegilops tauschii subsp. strangulata TaxID=200361 RepID=A0A453RUR8_AEGTS
SACPPISTFFPSKTPTPFSNPPILTANGGGGYTRRRDFVPVMPCHGCPRAGRTPSASSPPSGHHAGNPARRRRSQLSADRSPGKVPSWISSSFGCVDILLIPNLLCVVLLSGLLLAHY